MKYKKGTFSTVPNIDYLKGKPALQQVVFLWLCVHSDEDGICYPTRSTIAKECGCDVKSVDKYIRALEEDKVISKTNRKKENSKENTSNLYQIMILGDETVVVGSELNTLGGEIKLPTGGERSGAETKLITNQIQLTTISATADELTLPKEMGNAYTQRLLRLYSILFRLVVGFSYKGTMGQDLRLLKELKSNYSELQIAMLLIVYFQWRGVDGSSEKDFQFVVSTGFNLSMFAKTISKYEIYARNVALVDMDNPETLLDTVNKSMVKLQNQYK